jgi:lipoprotein signal peptidase
MDSEKTSFWFYAKSFGWGWGFPATWQGWLTLATYIISLIASQMLVSTPKYRFAFTIGLTVVLIIVISIKGERPLRWRWGDDQPRSR